MSVTLHIPDSITQGLSLPGTEIEQRLKIELAAALYGQNILSFGKASELAGLSRLEMAEQLGQRGIPRHYGPEELAEDIKYAGRE